MSNHLYLLWLLLLLEGLVLPEIEVSAVEISTPSEVVAVNGTDVKLSCTFKSTHPVSDQSLIVKWNYRPPNSQSETSVLYFQESSHPPNEGLFKNRVAWSGSAAKRDASITLLHVSPTFNGTYTCQVTNRPDFQGRGGEIVLKVVQKAIVSEIGMLAAAVGGSCAVILVILGIIMGVKFYKKRQEDMDIEEHSMGKTDLY
ncbi:myelin protein zero-like protein 2b [Oryzias melastigma]|uniref:myelin protein zero-like protein 2b n=1 Tax=Oryzias melastigma TaxID=30732 RepID=UPI000CF812DC|nr:myelin protein zero-like protein 2b [Oryzias melastigma]